PSGAFIQNRCLPPTRTSISAMGTVKPCGPYQFLKCSGCVHICQMTSTGASKVRSITIAAFDMVRLLTVLLLGFQLSDVAVHAVKAGLPDRAVLLCPLGYVFEGRCVHAAGSILRFLALGDQPCTLQDFDMLR